MVAIDNFIAMNKIEFLDAGREALFVPVALPKIGKTKAPGIVLLPAIAGMNDYVRRVAYRLSASGFAVAILDYFAREGRPPDISTPAAIDVAVNSLSDHRVLADACGLVGALREHEAINPERIDSLGFCIGGTYSLMLSAETPNLSASVDYYGSVRYAQTSDQKPVSPLDRAKAIQPRSLRILAHLTGWFPLQTLKRSRPNSSGRRSRTNFSPATGRLTPSMKTFVPRHIVPSRPNWPGSTR